MLCQHREIDSTLKRHSHLNIQHYNVSATFFQRFVPYGETTLPAKWSLARENARGILQIIPLERCPWLVGVRDCVLARTCTLARNAEGWPGQARPSVVHTLHNRAMPGRPGSIGPAVFIGDAHDVYT